MRSFFVSAVTPPRSGSASDRRPSAGHALHEKPRVALCIELAAHLLGFGPVGIAAHAHHVEDRSPALAARGSRGSGRCFRAAYDYLEAFLLERGRQRHGSLEIEGRGD